MCKLNVYLSLKDIETKLKDTVDDSTDDSDWVKWKCSNCNFMNNQKKKQRTESSEENYCGECRYKKPEKLLHWMSNSEFMVFGYCNINDAIYIPFVVKKLIQMFLAEAINCFLGETVTNPIGSFTANDCNMIYRWKFKLFANDSYIYEDSNNKCENPILKGANIGIIGTGKWGRKHGYMVFPGRGGLCPPSKYCRLFKSGDIVTMELNMINKTLSYGINDEWYGIANENIKPINYKVYVVQRYGAIVEIINVMSKWRK
eukprot:203715_1